jgi:hypothetical protein
MLIRLPQDKWMHPLPLCLSQVGKGTIVSGFYARVRLGVRQ